MADETYYSLLEISESASVAEIKTAHRRMIREVHPDRMANAPAYWQRQAEEKAKEVNEAYAVLSDNGKRRSYDAQLAAYRGCSGTTASASPPQSPPPPSSTSQGSQAGSGRQSASGAGAQTPHSAPQQHQPASTASANPSSPPSVQVGEGLRVFLSVIGSVLGFDATATFLTSPSMGNAVGWFFLASALWLGVAYLYRRHIIRMFLALRISQPRRQWLAMIGIIALALLALRALNYNHPVPASPSVEGKGPTPNAAAPEPQPPRHTATRNSAAPSPAPADDPFASLPDTSVAPVPGAMPAAGAASGHTLKLDAAATRTSAEPPDVEPTSLEFQDVNLQWRYSGWFRLTGRVRNNSQFTVTALTMWVSVSDCDAFGRCDALGEKQETFRVMIPPGQARDLNERVYIDHIQIKDDLWEWDYTVSRVSATEPQ